MKRIIFLVAVFTSQLLQGQALKPAVSVVKGPAAPTVASAKAGKDAAADIDQKALSAFSQSKAPLFSASGNNRLQAFKTVIASISLRSSDAILTKVFEEFDKVFLEPIAKINNIKMQNLEAVKEVIDTMQSSYALILGQLVATSDNQLRRAAIGKVLPKMKGYSDSLGRRIAQNRALLVPLADVNKISKDKVAERCALYEKILLQMDELTLDDIKNPIIHDLTDMAKRLSKKADASAENSLKQIVTKALAMSTFSSGQKKRLSEGLAYTFSAKGKKGEGKTALLSEQASHGTGKVSQSMLDKLKDFYDRKAVVEQCNLAVEIIGMITNSSLNPEKNSSDAEKNKVITLCNQMYMAIPGMNSLELQAVAGVVNVALANTALLEPHQKAAPQEWLETLGMALQVAKPGTSLLSEIKTILSSYKSDVKAAIKVVPLALRLLTLNLPKGELDKKEGTLVGVLRASIPAFYAHRTIKSIEYLSAVRVVLERAQKYAQIKDVVGKPWLDQMDILIALVAISNETNISKRLAVYKDLVKKMTAATDRFEKGMVIDDLATIYTNRKERAGKELIDFIDLINEFLSPAIKDKKIFADKDEKDLLLWKKIVPLTCKMFELQYNMPLQQRVEKLTAVIPDLAIKEAAYERTLFSSALAMIFAERGNMTAADFGLVQPLVLKIQASRGVVSETDAVMIQAKNAEVEQAKRLISGSKTYIEGLVQGGVGATKNIDNFIMALSLFTPKTSKDTTNAFISGLNDLFNAREKLDIGKLKRLLVAVNEKRVGTAVLLTQAQRDVIAQWLKMLG